MREVWKYRVPTFGVSRFEMPEGAEVLTVQAQNDVPCIWALVQPNRKKVWRHFMLVGTGRTIDDRQPLTYVGTFQQAGGSLVWHLFEVLEG